MTSKIVEEAKRVIEEGTKEVERRRNEEFIKNISQSLVAVLVPLLEKIAVNSKLTKQEIEEIIRQIKPELPPVTVAPSEMKIPEIIFPKEEIIGAIKKAFAGIVIKPPNVEVKPTDVKMPNQMEVKGIAGYFKGLIKALSGKLNVGLEDIDRDNPIHTVLVDKDGKYYVPSGRGVVMAGGGGKTGDASDIISDYNPSDIDDAGTVKYYGFLRADGFWYIQREDTTSGRIYRYVKGNDNYSTNWTNRTTLSYQYFNEVF